MVQFLLSVNVFKYLDICHLSVYHCVYSVLSQLSRIVANNGDSHKRGIYQNVQTCILEIDSTGIGIKVPTVVVHALQHHDLLSIAKIYSLSPLLRDVTPRNKFTTSFGTVCRSDVQMT